MSTQPRSEVGSARTSARDGETIRDHHQALADRIIALANPKTTLDVGCGPGLLVQALADQGVDAHGIDENEAALAGHNAEIRTRLEVQSATKPLRGDYDLISCLGFAERLDPQSAESAIDSLCAATGRVLFSISPDDASNAGHLPSQPMSHWAASFAERGFFRRTDVNLDFLSEHAALFERADLQPRDLVHRYESKLAPLTGELRERRDQLSRLRQETSAAERVIQLEGQLRQARHDVLTTRDHIIGLEAESLQLQSQVGRLTERLAVQQERLAKLRTRLANQQRRASRAEGKLQQVRESRAWRIGRRLTRSRTPEL